MYTYQYIFILIFFLLLFVKCSRFAALIFISSYFIYVPFILDLSGERYYDACALMELIKGYLLNISNKLVSYLCYVLIVINFLGFAMYENYMDPLPYDIICSIILAVQIILLIIRPLTNGSYRTLIPHWMVRVVNFDCGWSRVRMYKRPTKSKANS